jgi:hypothetical protein
VNNVLEAKGLVTVGDELITTNVMNLVKSAYEAADLAAFEVLLDPHVTWGPPGDPSPPCRTKEQVLDWYRRGRESGARAEVTEVSSLGDRILVGLVTSRTDAAEERGDEANRWQLLTIRDGLIVDIAGFDQRTDAMEFADLKPR